MAKTIGQIINEDIRHNKYKTNPDLTPIGNFPNKKYAKNN